MQQALSSWIPGQNKNTEVLLLRMAEIKKTDATNVEENMEQTELLHYCKSIKGHNHFKELFAT
jgi:hypothetical protein